MRKQKSEAVGLVVREFLRQSGLETPYNEYRLVQAWPEVVGQGIATYTSDLQIRNRILYVRLKSSVLRQELMLNRRQLAYRLNEFIGAQVIENIVFN